MGNILKDSFPTIIYNKVALYPKSINKLDTHLILHPSGGSNVINYALHWDLQYYVCVILFDSIFISPITSVCHCLGLFRLYFVCCKGKRHPVYGDNILDAILILCDGIQR